MTPEEYKQLNNYLNETFLHLELENEFFVNNIVNICALNDMYYDFIKDYVLDEESIENNLTYEDVYLLAREIIESIDPKYLKDYDHLIETGELDFGYEGQYYDSCFVHEESKKNKKNYINIRREFNYDDVVSLVHEYIHYTNEKDNLTSNGYVLSEFFSIYFEIYAIDYLIEKGIPKNEIDYQNRLRSIYYRSNNFLPLETPLIAYAMSGDISDFSYEFIKNKLIGFSKEDFYKECYILLEFFKKKEEKYEKDHFKEKYNSDEVSSEYSYYFSSHCMYLIGTILAFYARDYCYMDDIIYMNDHINDNGNDNYDILDCLKKMGIDLNQDYLMDKAFEGIYTYLSDYNIKSR